MDKHVLKMFGIHVDEEGNISMDELGDNPSSSEIYKNIPTGGVISGGLGSIMGSQRERPGNEIAELLELVSALVSSKAHPINRLPSRCKIAVSTVSALSFISEKMPDAMNIRAMQQATEKLIDEIIDMDNIQAITHIHSYIENEQPEQIMKVKLFAIVYIVETNKQFPAERELHDLLVRWLEMK